MQAFGINVPRMITLTYGFGVGLAALAGVMAAPIYSVSPLMGADLIIVVFAVVVIGGMGSIMGSILTGFVLGLVEGLTKVFYPEASNTVIFIIMAIVLMIKPAGLFGAQQMMAVGASERPARPARGADARGTSASRSRSWSRSSRSAPLVDLSRVPDEGDVLRALRVRLQPAAGLRRAAFLRARDVPRHGRLHRGARREGVGAHARSSRSSPAPAPRACSASSRG